MQERQVKYKDAAYIQLETLLNFDFVFLSKYDLLLTASQDVPNIQIGEAAEDKVVWASASPTQLRAADLRPFAL